MQRLLHRIGDAARDVRPAGSDEGFTLVEVVVSFVLFATVVAGASTGIVNSLDAAHVSQQRADAASIAEQYISSTRSSTQTAKDGTTAFYPAIGNESFRVERAIAFDSPYTGCAVTGATFRVRVKVWQKSTGEFLARSDARVLC